MDLIFVYGTLLDISDIDDGHISERLLEKWVSILSKWVIGKEKIFSMTVNLMMVDLITPKQAKISQNTPFGVLSIGYILSPKD